MTNLLPLNRGLKNVRTSVQLALAILPLGLAFFSFLPLFLFGNWLANVLDIPPNAPVNGQPNGLTYLLVFLVMFVVLFVFSFVAGWIANALICRHFFGWSKENVRAVFVRSELPKRWLNSNEYWKSPEAMKEAKRNRKIYIAKFECISALVALGLLVITTSAVCIGYPVFHIDPKMSGMKSIVTLLLLFIGINWIAVAQFYRYFQLLKYHASGVGFEVPLLSIQDAGLTYQSVFNVPWAAIVRVENIEYLDGRLTRNLVGLFVNNSLDFMSKELIPSDARKYQKIFKLAKTLVLKRYHNSVLVIDTQDFKGADRKILFETIHGKWEDANENNS